jgi:flagellar motor switch protein FliN/FliY
MNVRLPLTIRLGSLRMNLDELLQLTPGSILELDRRENEPLDVLSNGQVVARGEVVAVDDRFGLRITEIGPPSERIRTL